MISRLEGRGQRSRALLLAVSLLTALPPCRLAAQLPPLREQAAIQQQWLQYRLDSILPGLMRENGVQMWLVICREYNEDPVFFSIVSATTFACRRRTMYVFHDRGPDQPLERLALGGSSQGGLFRAVRDTTVQVASQAQPGAQRGGELVGAAQWALLRRVIEERNPRTIAINISPTHAFSDGLPAGEYEQLREALGPELSSRLVRAERLAHDYIALRTPGMNQWYPRLQEQAHDIIRRAFSRAVITPGRTTTEDVVWWTREELRRRGLATWFQTTVDVQRQGLNPDTVSAPLVIMPGDVLHIDFGLTAMRLNTDTQHMAYVPRPGEREPPLGLRRALANANRLQDIVMEELVPGRTGNEVLARSLARMREAGITGTVYSHPVGDHGHGAGPLIGLWDRQEGVPGRGDVPVLRNMWYSIELEARTPVPEWGGQVVKMALEEDAMIGPDGTVRWALRRQTELHVVR
ncbi:MAG TPA: M24 family metallopeptidase [Gemmatimonadales bacterium]|nr:M24 family metallopeptidase [Gemmatimonadales bacterium]